MCCPCNPYSPGLLDNSHRGKLFSSRLRIAQERVGACSPISGVIVDSGGISGPAIGMRGYVRGYGRRLGINDMGNEKPPQGVAMRGLVVVVMVSVKQGLDLMPIVPRWAFPFMFFGLLGSKDGHGLNQSLVDRVQWVTIIFVILINHFIIELSFN